VAWVYRNFPLDQLHPKARKEAEALECANELGGNDKFWEYTDRLYEITPANNGLEESELPKIAQYVGLDVQKFNSCLSSGKYAKKVEDDVKNATETGGNGTPWSIVITKDGKKYPLSGAQPYASVKQMIEGILNQK
jgi:protein-disulfide isomerase